MESKQQKIDKQLRIARKKRKNATGVERDYWNGYVTSLKNKLGESKARKPNINDVNIGSLNVRAYARGFFDGEKWNKPAQQWGPHNIKYAVREAITGAFGKHLRVNVFNMNERQFAKLIGFPRYQSVQMVERIEDRPLIKTWQLVYSALDQFGYEWLGAHGRKF